MKKDLIILVADKNTEFAVKGLLSRYHALKIRQVVSDLYVHPERDPGCLLKCDSFLRPFINNYMHAFVIFDREGCGREQNSREDLEKEVEERLAHSGWGNRAEVIILDPELEIWVWSDSPHVDSILGWRDKQPDLKTWLKLNGYFDAQRNKPYRPKEVLEEALRQATKARSSSLYLQLAKLVSLERCTDSAFLKFKAGLQYWFAD